LIDDELIENLKNRLSLIEEDDNRIEINSLNQSLDNEYLMRIYLNKSIKRLDENLID